MFCVRINETGEEVPVPLFSIGKRVTEFSFPVVRLNDDRELEPESSVVSTDTDDAGSDTEEPSAGRVAGV
ncbi:hypothetical protein C490_13660 [Natronobacterium gregoryi SP2]|uniref:Uncharacterized protein n=1 Tax=Natronobacterium gregoryi (strain ATCC 43098 / DSM 3393 / CCM 3738 / CIP 104747 / IAM 13177 / JCM 8860 / NBRC 102187 / NCIMB 2189 / SP2) TaxID=797304 RepID=L9XV74_NATGS|nr:hypothetical protein C490_13660 [Natronobacterium gregoryi SP2]